MAEISSSIVCSLNFYLISDHLLLEYCTFGEDIGKGIQRG